MRNDSVVLGAHQWRSIDDKTLQFAVQGWHFTVHVRIVYICGSDTYTIQFGHFKSGQWLMLEELEEVYFYQMIEIIDNRVENIPVVSALIKKSRRSLGLLVRN